MSCPLFVFELSLPELNRAKLNDWTEFLGANTTAVEHQHRDQAKTKTRETKKISLSEEEIF